MLNFLNFFKKDFYKSYAEKSQKNRHSFESMLKKMKKTDIAWKLCWKNRINADKEKENYEILSSVDEKLEVLRDKKSILRGEKRTYAKTTYWGD